MTTFGLKKPNPFNTKNAKPVTITGQNPTAKQQLQSLTDALGQRKSAVTSGGAHATPMGMAPYTGGSVHGIPATQNRSNVSPYSGGGNMQPNMLNQFEPGGGQITPSGGASALNVQDNSNQNGAGGGGSGGSGGYSSMNADQYRARLIESVRAGIMTEYEANASIIRNNLSAAMAALDNDLASLEPLYQQNLQTIAANQYSSSQQTKELMNASGWDASNSGLAVGAQTQISNAADKSRADSLQAKTTAETGIMNQKTLTAKQAADELATQEKIKNEKIASAEASARIQVDEIFAARTAADKAASAKAEAATSNAQKESIYQESVAGIYSLQTPDQVFSWLRGFMMDQTIPESVKQQIKIDAYEYAGKMDKDGTLHDKNSSSNILELPVKESGH